MIEKPAKKYIFWRFVAAVAISIVITGISVIIWASIAKNAFMQTAAFFPVFIGMLTLIAMIQGVYVFSFNYSLLGKLERSLPPPSFVAKYQTLSFGRIGIVSFSWPLVEWRVGKEGLQIKMLIGSAFIPIESILHVTRGHWMYDVLEHNCPDLASPVYLPKDVSEVARNICEIPPRQTKEVPATR